MGPHTTRPPQPRLPADVFQNYRGKWIALSPDSSKVVASADSLNELENQLVQSGIDAQAVSFDFIETDDTCLGGAELL